MESGKVVVKLEKDINDHLKRDYPDSFREKRLQIQKKQWKLTKEMELKREKKWLKFKNRKIEDSD